MDTKKILSAAVLAAVLATAAAPVSAAEDKEKCYGVVKAGQNSCKSVSHGCAAHAAKDADATEWLLVPAGLCAKLVGGSGAPPAGTPAPAAGEKENSGYN